MTVDLARLRHLYDEAVFGGDAEALDNGDRESLALEAEVAMLRGRLLHARWLRYRVEDPAELACFQRALEAFTRLGDRPAEGEARFWVGVALQVVRHDSPGALPYLREAHAIARECGDRATQAYAVRHLAGEAMDAGWLDEALAGFEESLRLREELGDPGPLAAAYLAVAQCRARMGELDEAERLMGLAEHVARDAGAQGVLAWVEAARGGEGR